MAPTSPLRQPYSQALALSQQAAQFLQDSSPVSIWRPRLPGSKHVDSTEFWLNHEKYFLSCLRTGDDEGAFICLERIIERFGPKHEKVMGLRGLYQEAVADDEATLLKILHDYDTTIVEDPTDFLVAKRRVALLRDLNRVNEAIDALVSFLESSPTDVEAWSELAELYVSQSFFRQAVFCLEEVLLITPNAWNAHARLGEVLFMESTTNNSDDIETLAESLRRSCRSVELCDKYLRGYYGMKLSSDRLLWILERNTGPVATRHGENSKVPSLHTVKQLNVSAAAELAEATRLGTIAGYDHAELAAAQVHLQQTEIRQIR